MITLLIQLAIAALTAFTAYEEHQPMPENPPAIERPATREAP